MSAYWIARGGEIKDEKALKQYGELWGPLAQRYGAQIIAGKGQIDTREGKPYARQLVIRFASYDDAVACYEDPDYQALLPIVSKAYDRELVILDGQD